MKVILDASAFLSGRITSLPDSPGNVFVTPEVVKEIEHGAPKRAIDNLLISGLLIRSPEDLEDAKKAAERTGDIELLSIADLSVIALAMEINGSVVMTDDFRIQNVLLSLDMKFITAGEIGDRTIKEVWDWTYRCRGCKKFFQDPPLCDCPICGSEIRKVRKRS